MENPAILLEHWLLKLLELTFTACSINHMAAKQTPHSLTLDWSEEEGMGLAFDLTQGVSG